MLIKFFSISRGVFSVSSLIALFSVMVPIDVLFSWCVVAHDPAFRAISLASTRMYVPCETYVSMVKNGGQHSTSVNS